VDIIERINNDESLTANLTDDEAERLLAWVERASQSIVTDQQAEQLLAALRALNHDVGRGKGFDEALAEVQGE
jgi:hypothetical protein